MATFAELFLVDFNNEIHKTRRLLQAVPDDNPDWKPHEKSFSIGKLAGHVGDLAGWPAFLAQDELVFTPGSYKPLDLVRGGRDALLAGFDEKAKQSQTVVAGMDDDHIGKHWKLKFGDHTVVDLPRSVVLRDVCLHHLIHHRGQLTVYLRLLGKPVPGLYGPSADEK